MCLCLGGCSSQAEQYRGDAIAAFVYQNCIHASVAVQCRSRKFVNPPLGRSSILSCQRSRLAKVDNQPIFTLQLVTLRLAVAEDRGDY